MNKRKIRIFFLKFYINKKNYFSIGFIAIAFLGYIFLFNGLTQIAEAVKVEYTENFSSEAYKDPATTLDWDTSSGELKLVGGDTSGSAISTQINNILGSISNVSFLEQDFNNNGQTVDFITNIVGNALNWQIDMSTADVNTTPVVRSFTLSYDVQDYNDDFTTNDYLDKTSPENTVLWDTDNDRLIPPQGYWTHIDESNPQAPPWNIWSNITTFTGSFSVWPLSDIDINGGEVFVMTRYFSGAGRNIFSKYIPGTGWTDLNGNPGANTDLIVPGYFPDSTVYIHAGEKMHFNSNGDLMAGFVFKESGTGKNDLFFAKWTNDPVLCAPAQACFTNMAETVVGAEIVSDPAVNTSVVHRSYFFKLDNNGNPSFLFAEFNMSDPAGTNKYYYTRWSPSACGGTGCWTYADQSTPGLEDLGNVNFSNVCWGDYLYDNTNNPIIVLNPDLKVGRWSPSACGGTGCWTYFDGTTPGFESITTALRPVKIALNSQNELNIIFERLKFTRWDSVDSRWEKMSGDPGFDTIVNISPIAYLDSGSLSFDANDYPLIVFNNFSAYPTERLSFTKWNGQDWTYSDGLTLGIEEISGPNGLAPPGGYNIEFDSNGYPLIAYGEEASGSHVLYKFKRYNGYALVEADYTTVGANQILQDGALTQNGWGPPKILYDASQNEIYYSFTPFTADTSYITKYYNDNNYEVDPVTGSTTRTAVSTKVNLDRHNYIRTATLTGTANTVPGSTVSYFMSNDGGSNWEAVNLNTPHTFTSCTATSADFDYNCNDLRYKVEITNTVDNQASFVDDLQLSFQIDETAPANNVSTSTEITTNQANLTLSGTTDWPYATLWINNEFVKRLDGTGSGPYSWTHDVSLSGNGDTFDIKIKNNKVLDTKFFGSKQVVETPSFGYEFIPLKYATGEYKDGIMLLQGAMQDITSVNYKLFKKNEFSLDAVQNDPWQSATIDLSGLIGEPRLGFHQLSGTTGQDGYGRLWLIGDDNGKIDGEIEYYYSEDLGQTWTYGWLPVTSNSEIWAPQFLVPPGQIDEIYLSLSEAFSPLIRVLRLQVNPLGSLNPIQIDCTPASDCFPYIANPDTSWNGGSLIVGYDGEMYFYYADSDGGGLKDRIKVRKLSDWNNESTVQTITPINQSIYNFKAHYVPESNEVYVLYAYNVSGGIIVKGIISNDGGKTFSSEIDFGLTTEWGDFNFANMNNLIHIFGNSSLTVISKLQNSTGYQSPVVRITVSPEQGGATAGEGGLTTGITAPSNLICQATEVDTILWNFEDNSDNETGFRLYEPGDNLILEVGQAGIEQITEDMLETNTQYTRYVAAYRPGDESAATDTVSCYTLANVPNMLAAETGEDYITIILDPEDSNPETTEYAIFEANTGKYVQSDGSFAEIETWLSYEGWGGHVDVIGGDSVEVQFNIALDTSQEYNFAVKARNGDGVETAFSPGTTGEVVGEEPAVPGQPAIVISKGVGINISQGQISQVLAKAVFATSGQTSHSINERLIIEFSLILNIILVILIILLLISIYEALKHIQVKGFINKIKIVLNLLHKEPASVFAQHTNQDKKGTYNNSYEKYKRLHEYSQKTVARALGIIILKLVILVVLILGVIGVNHRGIAQVAPYNQDGQEVQQGDILSYQISFANQGDIAATNVLITDIMDTYVSYVQGSGILNKGGEVIDGVTRTNQQMNFAVSDLEAGETGSAIFAAQVNSDIVGTIITNQAQISGDNFGSQTTNTVINTIIKTTEPPPVEPPPVEPPPVEPPPVEPPPVEPPPVEPPPVEPPPVEPPPVEPPPVEPPPVTPPPVTPPPVEPLVPAIIGSFIQENKVVEFVVEEIFENPQVEEASQNVVTPVLITVAILNTIPTAVVVASNILMYLHLLFFEPFLWLFRKKRKKWGIVYDALTKLPVDLAVVRLYSKNNRKLIQTRVTDKKGRYLMIVKKPGQYYLSVSKPGYVFPTQFLKESAQDTKYLDLYHGEAVEINDENIALTANIPLDLIDKKVATVKEIIRSYLIKNLRLAVSYIGIVLSILVVLIIPTLITIGALIVHLALFAMFRRLIVPRKPKSWGIIYDKKTKKPLKQAVIKIFDLRFNKLLEAQVSDSKGRYAFLVGKNEYQLLSEKPGYQRKQIKPVDLVKNEEIINLDIGLDEK